MFSRIIGQERAKKFLKQAMAKDKMPHAYLFTGIPGIGKTTMAMALAMALNCREPQGGDSCGRCACCRQILGGNSPDFVVIEPQGQFIKIEQVRELNRSLGFAPMGNCRVSVVRRAEAMTDEAANSFLKTLEEPPPGNIFVLSTTEPYDLLPTIVSRCQRVAFGPIPVKDMSNWFVKEMDKDEETAGILANISGGSLGRAIEISKTDYLDRRQEWLLRVLRLPGMPKDKVMELAVECATGEGKRGFKSPGYLGSPIMEMLFTWKTWYRDLMLLSAGGPPDQIINGDFSHKLKKMAEMTIMKNLIESVLIINRAEIDLKRNRNVSLVMEHTILTLSRLAGRGRA